MMKNVIGKEVRFFKVTVGLFLLLFSNCSVQNCLSPARNRGRSPPWPVWWAPWCKSSLIWRKECSQMLEDVVSGLVFPLGDGHFGWTVCLSWGVWEVGQVPALNYEGPHKTEILKGKGEIQLVFVSWMPWNPGYEVDKETYFLNSSFLQSKFRRPGQELYCYLRLMTPDHEGWSLRCVKDTITHQ